MNVHWVTNHSIRSASGRMTAATGAKPRAARLPDIRPTAEASTSANAAFGQTYAEQGTNRGLRPCNSSAPCRPADITHRSRRWRSSSCRRPSEIRRADISDRQSTTAPSGLSGPGRNQRRPFESSRFHSRGGASGPSGYRSERSAIPSMNNPGAARWPASTNK